MIEGVFPGTDRLQPVSASLTKALHYIETVPLEQLYSFTLREDVLEELCRVTTRLRKTVMDRMPNSLEMTNLYEEVNV